MKANDGHQDLSAFCHRLGSPLGAAVNHLFLLEMDRSAMPAPAQTAVEGLQAALNDTRALLDTARIWIDAHARTFDLVRLTAENAREALQVDATDLNPNTVKPNDRGWIETDIDALQTIGACMTFHGQVHEVDMDTQQLRVSWISQATFKEGNLGVLLDPFGGGGTLPRWACARALLRRMGLDLDCRHMVNEHTTATLSLPLSPNL